MQDLDDFGPMAVNFSSDEEEQVADEEEQEVFGMLTNEFE